MANSIYRSISRALRWTKNLLVHSYKLLWNWLWGLLRACLQLWRALGPRWLRVILVLLAVAVFAYDKLHSYLKPNLTEENIYTLQYLNQGWTSKQRQQFYYTPQGTELLGMEYQWFVNLELPLSHELLASEANMRGWGFIVAPGQRPSPLNPGNLPVGFGRHMDPSTGKEHLDIGCATCHSGELHYQGTALRVDGGQAVHSIPNAKAGEFINTLGAAVIETLFNPIKWDRFATRLAGRNKSERDKLKKRFKQFARNLKRFSKGAGAKKYYPVEEGRGRTDAVGRIGNVVFGFDLDEPANYRVADAPASYPFLWDIWRFDWVQYTGFTNQAMARNVGESLGVLAPIKLIDAEGKRLTGESFGETVVDVDGMHCIEGLLRKLEPPRWPENIFPKINISKAQQGKDLFLDRCAYCHGPHISKPYKWQVTETTKTNASSPTNVNTKWEMAGDISLEENIPYRLDWRKRVWSIPLIDTEIIGTDPKLANNFVDNRYDASKLVPGSSPVNAGEGLQLLLNELIPDLYETWGVSSSMKVASYDGLNVPFRIQNQRAYKSRPLHGVWATPPFLHNGSVPTIYDLLSPLRARPTTFYVGNREYDPQKLGYQSEYSAGSFLLDTRIEGNRNTGHLFTDVDMPGRIGHLLKEEERYAILEYIKVMGNPDFDQALNGDPLNWDNYNAAPEDDYTKESCLKSHSRHGLGNQ